MIPQEKMQEIQILEQNLQALLMQKQAFQMELNETDSALQELKKSDDDSYKLTGQILIKKDKKDLEKELREKKDIIELRLKSIEKQENQINEKTEEIKSNSKKLSKEK